MRKIILILSLSIATTIVSACSPVAPSKKFLSSGSIVISQTIPTQSKHQETKSFAPLMGYFPASQITKPSNTETWLELDRANHTLRAIRNEEVVFESKAQFSVVTASLDKVKSIAANPLWRASDEYLSLRDIKVSSEKERMLRGALGEYALFLDSGVVLHCSPVFVDQVGGVRISKVAMTKLLELTSVGTKLEVR